MVKKNEPSIRKVMLRNFKSVVDQQEVEFGFLTLLMGENSSGKSSILQVLRLLQQSLKSEAIGRFPLNGRHIRVGAIEEIQNDKENKSNVFFGVEMGRKNLMINWKIEINDAVADAPSFTNIKKLDLDWKNLRSNATLSAERDQDSQSGIVDIKYGVDVDKESRTETITGLSPWWNDRKADIGFTGTLSLSEEESELMSIPVSGLILEGSVPASVTVEREAKRVFAEVWLNSIIERNERQRDFDKYKEEQDLQIDDKQPGIRDKAKLVRYAVSRISALLDKKKFCKISHEELYSFERSKEEKVEWLLEEEFFKNIKETESEREDIIQDISKKISKIKTLGDEKMHLYLDGVPSWYRLINSFDIRYLGPLRKAPRLLMPAFAEDNIGEEGEYTTAVLAHQGEARREYPVPNLSEPELDTYSVKDQYSWKEASLKDAIIQWGKRLKLLDDVAPKDMGAFGIGIEITPTNSSLPLPLPAVGVGVSQLLPVLVCCILAKPGDIILLEQPELHIHPALQQHLADFLICMSHSGRQLIVETHSEYILSRLRRRIVEESDDEVMNLVKVIFAERDQSGTKYRPLNFTIYGNLEEWPEGFFDQATEDERKIIEGAYEKWEKRKPSDLPEGG